MQIKYWNKEKLGLDEGFIDATCAPAKKWRSWQVKGTKIIAIGEAHDYPIAEHIESASPGEAALVENTIKAKIMSDLPTRLIGYIASDCYVFEKN